MVVGFAVRGVVRRAGSCGSEVYACKEGVKSHRFGSVSSFWLNYARKWLGSAHILMSRVSHAKSMWKRAGAGGVRVTRFLSVVGASFSFSLVILPRIIFSVRASFVGRASCVCVGWSSKVHSGAVVVRQRWKQPLPSCCLPGFGPVLRLNLLESCVSPNRDLTKEKSTKVWV